MTELCLATEALTPPRAIAAYFSFSVHLYYTFFFNYQKISHYDSNNTDVHKDKMN